MLDLDELEAKARAATPGKWCIKLGQATFGDGSQVAYVMQDAPDPHAVIAYEVALTDAAHIAAANPATVLALIERVRRAERENEVLGTVYGIAASLRTFPVPFDDHWRLVGAVDEARAALDAAREKGTP
jgi:hypothetical protein